MGKIFRTEALLPVLDDDLDRGIRSEAIAIMNMTLGVPMPNAPPDLAEKVEAALLGQVSEIADQVCDGILIVSAAVP